MNPLYTNDPAVTRLALAAFPAYNGRSFAVTVFPGSMSLTSNWEGGSRTYWRIIHAETLQGIEIPQNGTPFDGRLSGGVVLSELPVNTVLVKHCIFRGKDLGLTVYVRPENLAPLLPAPVDLTWIEKVVLSATRGLKSFARYDGAQRDCGVTRAEFDAAKPGLIARGFLNKAGAITNEGRNAIGSVELYQLNKAENGGRAVRGW